MTHHQKVERLIAEMKQTRWSHMAAPPLFRFFWKLGWNVKPPLFMSFLTLTLILTPMFGIFVGVPSGVVMWMMLWLNTPLHWAIHVSMFASLGFLVGVTTADKFRRVAKKLELPAWSSYPLAMRGSQP